MKHPWLTTPIAALALLALTLSACSDRKEQADPAPVAVRIVQPERRTIHESLEYLGSVHSTTEIQITARLQGSVASIDVEEGASIRRGARLLRLFVPDLEAGVERLRTERDYWCRRSATDARLLEQQAIAADQADAGRRACESAKAALKEAVARLDRAVEHAPVGGLVLRRFVEPGQHVMPGQPLLLVGSGEAVVHAQVIEEDLARGVRVGMSALLVQDGNDTIPARVVEIAPVTTTGSRVFTVKVRPERNAALTARHGSSVSVRFLLAERKDVLALPVHALVGERPDAAVFLVRGDRAFRQTVRTGIEEDGWIEASFPWNGKDAVATSNLGSLSDSTRVFGVSEQEATR